MAIMMFLSSSWKVRKLKTLRLQWFASTEQLKAGTMSMTVNSTLSLTSKKTNWLYLLYSTMLKVTWLWTQPEEIPFPVNMRPLPIKEVAKKMVKCSPSRREVTISRSLLTWDTMQLIREVMTTLAQITVPVELTFSSQLRSSSIAWDTPLCNQLKLMMEGSSQSSIWLSIMKATMLLLMWEQEP